MREWERGLAVVILNYNGYDLTIESTNNFRKVSSELNIIIVDNCSKNDSLEKLKGAFSDDKNTHIIANDKNTGYTSGNNVGLRYISDNLKEIKAVCISNPDIFVESASVLESLYNALLEDESLAVVTAKTIYNGTIKKPDDCAWMQPTKRYMMFGSTCVNKLFPQSIRYNEFFANENGIAYVHAVQGCFFMAEKAVMESIGYFDEGTFLYSEEIILAKKIQNAGYKEGVLVNEYIHHNHREKDKSLIKKANKIFDMKCFYHSKKYYNAKFSGKSRAFTLLANGFLNLDYGLKRLLMLFK